MKPPAPPTAAAAPPAEAARQALVEDLGNVLVRIATRIHDQNLKLGALGSIGAALDGVTHVVTHHAADHLLRLADDVTLPLPRGAVGDVLEAVVGYFITESAAVGRPCSKDRVLPAVFAANASLRLLPAWVTEHVGIPVDPPKGLQ